MISDEDGGFRAALQEACEAYGLTRHHRLGPLLERCAAVHDMMKQDLGRSTEAVSAATAAVARIRKGLRGTEGEFSLPPSPRRLVSWRMAGRVAAAAAAGFIFIFALDWLMPTQSPQGRPFCGPSAPAGAANTRGSGQ